MDYIQEISKVEVAVGCKVNKDWWDQMLVDKQMLSEMRETQKEAHRMYCPCGGDPENFCFNEMGVSNEDCM